MKEDYKGKEQHMDTRGVLNKMSDVPPVAEYTYSKNQSQPSSIAEMFVGEAAKEIRAVLSAVNSSTEQILKDLVDDVSAVNSSTEPILKDLVDDVSAVNSSTEPILKDLVDDVLMSSVHLITDPSANLDDNFSEDNSSFPTTAVNFIIDSVTENVTGIFQTLSVEENSTESFELIEGTSGTFIGNLTAMNSTLTGQEIKDTFIRDLIFFGAVVFICLMIVIHQIVMYMQMHCRSTRKPEEVCTPSAAKYRSAKIDDEIISGLSLAESSSSEEGGEIRKNEALVPRTLPKPKKNKNYTSLPIVWDFDDKAPKFQVAQIEDEHVMKDTGTQTAAEEIDNVAVTVEQLDKLKEECKDFEYMDA